MDVARRFVAAPDSWRWLVHRRGRGGGVGWSGVGWGGEAVALDTYISRTSWRKILMYKEVILCCFKLQSFAHGTFIDG